MSNSELATLTMLSPHYRTRTHAIDTVTVHHTAAVGVSAAAIAQEFQHLERNASANYAIGSDGQIVLIVPEDKRAITSSSSANDNRAVTIEVANSAGGPDWPVSSDAYAALILLLTDVCRRNSIPELRWKADKSLIGQTDRQNMTVHRWFAATACPGDYLYSRMGDLAAAVNARLGAAKEDKPMRYNTLGELPDWGRPTIRKLMLAGILQGKTSAVDADGLPASLDLSEDMLRLLVLNDRAGIYEGIKIVGGVKL